MGSHPINLAARFIFEITALISIGMYVYRTMDWNYKLLPTILAPVMVAVIWGVFAVPGDPSRSGAAPVPVPGIIRLVLELAIFFGACWCLYKIGYTKPAIIFALLIVIHYLVSYDRVLWLLKQ